MYNIQVELESRVMEALVGNTEGDYEEGALEADVDELKFSFGNPRVEHITGVVHLFKNSLNATDGQASPSSSKKVSANFDMGDTLCCLAIPSDMSVASFCSFMGAYLEHVVEMKALRREATNQSVCMMLMKFGSSEQASNFYHDYNAKPFSSLEPEIICKLVHVGEVEVLSTSRGKGAQEAPPQGYVELPTCPVCLERLDENISGIVTTVCNHRFHGECLKKWGDTKCPVCRYCMQSSLTSSKCSVCSTSANLWICLICGHVGCGRYKSGHAHDHFKNSQHCYALELETQRVWDYVGDGYVHRLVQSKTDGKLVEVPPPMTTCSPGPCIDRRRSCGSHPIDPIEEDEGMKEALLASKLDAITTEYNHLLATQLDSQRQYFETLLSQSMAEAEQRVAQLLSSAEKSETSVSRVVEQMKDSDKRRQALERKVGELTSCVEKLTEEKEFLRSLNETLLVDQKAFRQQVEVLEKEVKGRDATIQDLEEQVRDLMVFIEAGRTIEAAGELKDATLLPVPPPVRGRDKGKKKGQRK